MIFVPFSSMLHFHLEVVFIEPFGPQRDFLASKSDDFYFILFFSGD
jgi:hypothetical protein